MVLALALFVAAATIISSGINASIRSVDRIRLHAHAANLAITLMSEMHMHARSIAATGPERFAPPFQDWTYQIQIAQSENSIETPESLRPVEVIVRHSAENVVQRLTELFVASEVGSSETNSIETPFLN